MFGTFQKPAQSYARVSVDTGVAAADSHRLIEMLYEKLDELLIRADAAVVEGDLARKGEALSHAIRIIDEGLRAALDPRAGELAQRLQSLYDYSLRQLLDANRLNDRGIIAQVRSLMHELHEAWTAIGSRGDGSAGR